MSISLYDDSLIGLYRAMVRVRMTEEEVALRYSEWEMRCPTHLCIGQEAIAVGVCSALERHDGVFSNHRAHGHYLAKGGHIGRMIAEFYGRVDGCCGGRGGSMHLIDLEAGFLGSTPIVGGTVPLAVGSAWANKLLGKRVVTVAFFGDGCFEEGVVHESMNFAALHNLPILFICENNEFSVFSHLSNRQPNRPIFDIARSHGWSVHSGDGNDVIGVQSASRVAVQNARQSLGPQFLQFSVYRWREHCGPNFDDDLGYRSADTIQIGLAQCPIARLGAVLSQEMLLNEQVDKAIREEVAREITAAFEFAKSSPHPRYQDSTKYVYSEK